jgi:glycosyltransferase involved in cell wall biosynthesis
VTVPCDDVSVVMTVRDGERYLAEALDSVLGQSAPPGQVVVVDDGSCDGTPEVLERYAPRVERIGQGPEGIARGLNRAVAAADRPLLAFLDADDVWAADSLDVRRPWLDPGDAGGPDAVVGRTAQFVSPDVPEDAATRFRFDPAPTKVRLFGAMLVSRAAFLRVGVLDEELAVGAAIDWISRADVARLRVVQIDDVVLHRRLHGRNVGLTTSDEVTRRALHDVVRAHHGRRPGSPGAGGP